MTAKLTTEQFVDRASQLHNIYDYSQVVYKNSATKVCIVCPQHGPFSQRPVDHLRGQGCPACKKIEATNKIRKPLIAFIDKATDQHGAIYDYSHVVYKNTHTPIIICCPQHGPFSQRPVDHLRGQGCPACKKTKIANANRLTDEEFITRSRTLHDNKYSYHQVMYKNNTTPVKIECPVHGTFWQTPVVHLRGGGCKLCSDDRNRSNRGGYSYDFFKVHPDMRDHPALLYLVKLTSPTETLLKIGITTKNNVRERFRSTNTFYGYTIDEIITINTTLFNAFEIEQHIIQKFAQFQTFPKKRFNGFTECFAWAANLESTLSAAIGDML